MTHSLRQFPKKEYNNTSVRISIGDITGVQILHILDLWESGSGKATVTNAISNDFVNTIAKEEFLRPDRVIVYPTDGAIYEWDIENEEFILLPEDLQFTDLELVTPFKAICKERRENR